MAVFKLHDFVMKTLNGMRNIYSEFQVREYALNWYAKGVLKDEDLMEIEEWYAVIETEESEDIPLEEPISE